MTMSFYAGALTGLFLLRPVYVATAKKLYDKFGIRLPTVEYPATPEPEKPDQG